MSLKLKTIIALFVAALLVAGLAGGAFAADPEEGRLLWKFATLAPKGTGWATNMQKIVLPAIDDATEGNLEVKIYWGGVMGDEEEYIKKMHIGQLHGAGFGGQGATLVCPEMAVVELPFLFNDYEEVDYIKKKMESTFDEVIKNNGYFMVAWNDQDFDQLLSSGRSFTKLEDFEKAKIVTWYGPLEVALLEALKTNPIPLNVPEVAAGARTKTFEVAIGPSMFVVGAQLHNTMKNINACKIRYSPALIVLTDKTWKELPQKYAKKYYEMRMSVMDEYNARVREDNAKTLKALYKYGINENVFPPEELARVKEATKVVWDQMAGELYPQDLLDEILEHLEEFRENKSQS